MRFVDFIDRHWHDFVALLLVILGVVLVFFAKIDFADKLFSAGVMGLGAGTRLLPFGESGQNGQIKKES